MFNVKLTAGRLFSSSDGRASRFVTAAAMSLDEAVQAGIDALAQSVTDGEHIERMGAFINRKKK